MELRFIGQGYNTTINTSVAEVLITSINNEQFHSFTCLVAFASYSGVTGLTGHVNNSRNHLRNFRVVVGIDQNGTSKEALEALLEWEVDSYIFNTGSNFIFHPKIYIFEGDENIKIIIGSNNLTQTGLSQNIESSIEVSFSKDDEEGMRFFEEIKTYYNPIIDGPHVNLKQLTNELIERLLIEGKIPTESQRRSLYNKSQNEPNIQANEVTITFPRLHKQQLPPGFSPRKLNRPSNVIPTAIPEVPTPIIMASQINSDTNVNEILIAEIGKGRRWTQVNFPISMFVNYFGATAGDNSYNIQIRHIENDGSLSEVETRQAVTVQSQNYRFEIGAARGLGYPTPPNRPIVIFIKMGISDFLYKLFMPNSANYNEINSYLIDNYNGPDRNLRRIIKPINDIQENCIVLYRLIQNYVQ